MVDGHTLFQNTVKRFSDSGILSFNHPLTVTHSDYRFFVSEQLKEISFSYGSILLEPLMRNTAPSVLAGCLHICDTAANSIVVISPSDHKIEDTVEFHRALKLGLSSADSGRIVTFGKIPERAETGYGYIPVSYTHLTLPTILLV